LTAYQSYRYAKADIDPDWAYFNLTAFTGARYGRDFPDCKTPAIHLWYWLLAKIVGADIGRVRFAHHMLLGSAAALVVGGAGALALVVLLNSGWLLAFHGNVGQHPALFLAIALLAPSPWMASLFWLAAVFFEPNE